MLRNEINPPFPYPLETGVRFRLSFQTLGKLERLAKSRFHLRELTAEGVSSWHHSADVERVLVQSVLASSEIEGEGIVLEEMPLDLAAVTKAIAETGANATLRKRLEAVEAITHAALWALSLDSRTYISYDFVIELHQRMFSSTLPQFAGKLKTQQNRIVGGYFDLKMLPPEKTEEYLRALCERSNKHLQASEDYPERSSFLTIAEFICDFLAIHPFGDGNGRTARLLSTYLLEKTGYHFARFYPLDNIILETRPQFYLALYNSQQNWYLNSEDLTDWVEYYTNAVFMQWTRTYQRVRDSSLQKAQG